MITARDRYFDALPEGYRLHWYELKSVLGRGGYGVTYLAHDNNLDQAVAIKEYFPVDFARRHNDETVHPMSGEKSDIYKWGLGRFIDEARTLAKFKHSNIITVHSVFEQNQTAYMVMEYTKGTDLEYVYRDSCNLSENQLLDIFLPVADGLSLVHESGFIHRDIKPANIYLRNDNNPVLLDFGSARQSVEGKTHALTSLVTFGYAPYEQFNEGDGKQGAWTDIYGLGASIYVGITGRKPVDALKRVSGIVDDGIDPYEPVSLLLKDQFSECFLLAIDYSLRFRPEDRPKHINPWADMLSGKLESPALHQSMYKNPAASDGETVLRPFTPNLSSSNITTIQSASTGRYQENQSQTVRYHLLGLVMLIRQSLFMGERLRLFANAIKKQAVITVLAIKTKSLEIKSKLVHLNIILVFGSVLLVVIISVIVSTTSRHSQALREKKQIVEHKIDVFLKQADEQKKNRHYLGKYRNNALFFYLQASQLEPSNDRINKYTNDLLDKISKIIKTNIQNNQLKEARKNILLLEFQLPESPLIPVFHSLLTEKHNKNKIEQWIIDANKAMEEKKYAGNIENNAYELFNEALKYDNNNKYAVQGIENIKQALLAQAEENIKLRKYILAKEDILNLMEIDPDSIKYSKIISKIDSYENINNFLKEADGLFERGRLTRPTGNNAFEKYRKVLAIDRENSAAIKGIIKINKIYEKKFYQNINNMKFNKAIKNLDLLKYISMDNKNINKMSDVLSDAVKNHNNKNVRNNIHESEAVFRQNIPVKSKKKKNNEEKNRREEKYERIPLSTFM